MLIIVFSPSPYYSLQPAQKKNKMDATTPAKVEVEPEADIKPQPTPLQTIATELRKIRNVTGTEPNYCICWLLLLIVLHTGIAGLTVNLGKLSTELVTMKHELRNSMGPKSSTELLVHTATLHFAERPLLLQYHQARVAYLATLNPHLCQELVHLYYWCAFQQNKTWPQLVYMNETSPSDILAKC